MNHILDTENVSMNNHDDNMKVLKPYISNIGRTGRYLPKDKSIKEIPECKYFQSSLPNKCHFKMFYISPNHLITVP